jgi:hypothetical protein
LGELLYRLRRSRQDVIGDAEFGDSAKRFAKRRVKNDLG